MDPQHVIDALIGLLFAVMGFFMKTMHNKIESQAQLFSDHKEYVARSYPTNDSIDKRFDKLEVKMDRLLDKIETIAEK